MPPMEATQKALRADGGGRGSAIPLISQSSSDGTLSNSGALEYLASRHISFFAPSQPQPDITAEEALSMLTNQSTLAQIVTKQSPSISMPNALFQQQQLSLVAPFQPTPLDLLYRGSNAISSSPESLQQAQPQTYGQPSILAPTNNASLPTSVNLRLELLRKLCGQGGR